MVMLKLATILLLLLPPALANPVITEVMANPLNESDEWIELYSPQPVNVSEWLIGDRTSNDTIVCSDGDCITSGYFLITGKYGARDSINPSAAYFTTDDSRIGNGLANANDCVRISQITSQNPSSQPGYDFFCWNSTVEGKSWTLLEEDGWALCQSPTPGEANSCAAEHFEQAGQSEEQVGRGENVVLKPHLTSDVYVGETSEDIFKVFIENKDDCTDRDKVRVNFNISGAGSFYTSSWEREIGCSGYDNTGIWAPESEGRYTICGAVVSSTSGDYEKGDSTVCWAVNAIERAVADRPNASDTSAAPPTPAAAGSEKKISPAEIMLAIWSVFYKLQCKLGIL